MPKREDIVTVTGGPQGEDSWIKVKYPTIDAHRANIAALTDLPVGSLEQEMEARKHFSQYVINWNWVDGSGSNLPCPYLNPAAFGALIQPEIDFMAAVVGGKIKPISPSKKSVSFTEHLMKLAKEVQEQKKKH